MFDKNFLQIWLFEVKIGVEVEVEVEVKVEVEVEVEMTPVTPGWWARWR